MAPQLTPDAMANIAGWISIACWIVVYSPQIWENYLLKSGEGLSVTFIVLWLLGDLTNLFGAGLAGLLPTMIILAVYYTICDVILLFQVYYYRHVARRRANAAGVGNGAESTPLLAPAHLPPSAQPKPLLPPILEYPLLLLFVASFGVLAWYLSPTPDVSIPEQPGKGGEVALEWKSQALGYASAALYIGSRVPQIAHNYKTRCAGLSLAMFFFSITGNITYVLSILVSSLEERYLLANLPWLAGSGLTVFLDIFVLGQFAVFSWQDGRKERGKVLGEETDAE